MDVLKHYFKLDYIHFISYLLIYHILNKNIFQEHNLCKSTKIFQQSNTYLIFNRQRPNIKIILL